MRKSLYIVFILTLILGILPFASYAEASNRTIRVALMIDSGGALNTSRSVATLSSPLGMQISAKSGPGNYVEHNSSTPIRFSPNQYRILVAETNDWLYADSLLQNLNRNGYVSYLLTFSRKNITYYQIITGDEPTYELAKEKMHLIHSQLGVVKEVLGPHALTAGAYAGEADASTQVQQLVDAGFDASVGSIINADGSLSYMVVVGNEGTYDEVTSLWQEVLLAFPSLSLTPIESTQYITRYNGLAQSGGSFVKAPHYYFPVNEALVIRTLGNDPNMTIAFLEKDNRRYRGEFELLTYKGRLAVVNQLPLEEYLYSVVGTEMASGWPLEALKAQAVIARTYAVGRGNAYSIANVSDTTYDQAYYGVQREAEDVRQAVRETAGLVLTYQGKLIEAYYYANAGGQTAIGTEVWGRDIPYLASVLSPDSIANQAILDWYLVIRENGQLGYIRSDLVQLTGKKTTVGFDIVEVLYDNTNFRSDPSVLKPSLDKLILGEQLTLVTTVSENSSYSWVEGPIDGVTLMNLLNARATSSGTLPHTRPIDDLKVTSRGPSGRVLSMTANGLPLQVTSPDGHRTLLGGLKSTLFEVEETGRFTIIGAGGKKVEYPQANEPLTILGAGNQAVPAQANTDSYLLYGGNGDVRIVTTYPAFRFHGKGHGHGFGLSQWGARGFAEQGYDYQYILKHYYSEQVSLQKLE